MARPPKSAGGKASQSNGGSKGNGAGKGAKQGQRRVVRTKLPAAAAAAAVSSDGDGADAIMSMRDLQDHRAFWEALPDAEFFGGQVQHLYFYGPVTPASVGGLRDELLAASRGTAVTPQQVRVSPLPIVIHVHSPGGDMYSMNWMLAMFNQVSVPICVMVDGVSASAATALSVMAPYRVGTPHSLSLLHDLSCYGASGHREELLSEMSDVERHREMIKRLYAARTRLTDAQLEAMLRRDLWLDAPACLRHGIYDRVVRPDRGREVAKYMARASMATLQLARAPFLKTNWNVLFADCTPELVRKFDAVLAAPAKPIVFLTPSSAPCDDLIVMVTLIARIRSSPVPVFGVIDSVVTWWQLLPVLYCHRRYMYENTALDANMVYNSAWGGRLQDIVDNANTFRGLVRAAVQERGTPTRALLADMFERRVYLTPQQCKDNGLIDEVVPLSARRATRKLST